MFMTLEQFAEQTRLIRAAATFIPPIQELIVGYTVDRRMHDFFLDYAGFIKPLDVCNIAYIDESSIEWNGFLYRPGQDGDGPICFGINRMPPIWTNSTTGKLLGEEETAWSFICGIDTDQSTWAIDQLIRDAPINVNELRERLRDIKYRCAWTLAGRETAERAGYHRQ